MSSYDDPDVRPFFGENSEPAGVVPPREQPQPTYATYEQRRQWRMAEGLCPACSTATRDDFCERCGWSLMKECENERARAAQVEERDDYLPRLPGALFLDEYGPANVDEDAVA